MVIGEAKPGLYQIHLEDNNQPAEANNYYTVDLITCHHHLGHACKSTVRKLVGNHGLSANLNSFTCEACTLSKHHHLPYKSRHQKSSFLLELIYAVFGVQPLTFLLMEIDFIC